MHRLWSSITAPILNASQPQQLLQIGAAEDENTSRLVAWCEDHYATLHVVEISPPSSLSDIAKSHPDHVVLYADSSLTVIPRLPEVDVAIIDGDHNYYTVYHELNLLAQHNPVSEGRFPIVILHDIHWPYGRRDLYYDPDQIPDSWRLPYVRGGLNPNHVEPDPNGGIDSHLFHAKRPNLSRSGVLSAIEDFLNEQGDSLLLTEVPGLHGAGILSYPLDQLEPNLRQALNALDFQQLQTLHVNAIEQDRLYWMLREHQERHNRITLERSGFQDPQAIDSLQTQLDEQQRQVNAQLQRTQELKRRAESAELALRRLRSRKVVRLGLGIADRIGRNRRATKLRLRNILLRLGTARSGPATNRQPFRWRPSVPNFTVGLRGSGALPAPLVQANIIVPVHNALEDVNACLESIQSHTNLVQHKLILVDDGSNAATAQALDGWTVRLNASLVRRPSAGGFSVAASAGLNASWLPAIVLLNSDTVVGPGWIERLLSCAESDPSIGIVGPWSNAATWQSIPDQSDQTGSWSTNPSIRPEDVDEINATLATYGVRLRPRVPLVNGFCYLLTQHMLDVVGFLDAEAFPKGYGEEDDLTIRASHHGFTAAIADDCFVYHTKAQSYGLAARDEISKASQETLRLKHGPKEITRRTRQMQVDRDLVRARTHAAELLRTRNCQTPLLPSARVRVAWLQPHLHAVGGVRRSIELLNRLALADWDVSVIVPDQHDGHEGFPRLANCYTVSQAAREEFDCLIVSDPEVVPHIRKINAKSILLYHLDVYYTYRTHHVDSYYRLATEVTNIVNSTWTGEMVSDYANVSIMGVIPGGVNLNEFAPRSAEMDHDVICYGSSRPRKRTWLAEEACTGLRLGKLTELSTRDRDLSWQYSRARLFLSTSNQEGFNLPCLEAMACGVPVVKTLDGGSQEYVKPGENALVVDDGDPQRLRHSIDALLADSGWQADLIKQGIETAYSRSWDSVVSTFADAVIRACNVPGW